MEEEKKYCGVVVPMITPVNGEGELDPRYVEQIIKMFAEAGVSPLLMGTTGEGNSVSQKDGLLLVETAVKARNAWEDKHLAHLIERPEHVMTIYAGLTGNCFNEQVAQAEAYTRAGADVIVATLPTYYALTPDQMENYYRQLADRITGPLMLYNILATTHMSIPVEVIRRLADHPNIVGLKDSERDLERMEQCIAIAKDREDFSYFCGWAAQSAHSLELGGDGIVPSTANYVPKAFQELYKCATRGMMDRANHLQAVTDEIAKIYQEGRTLGQSLAALKVMMGLKNLCIPYMLMPLTELTYKEKADISSKCFEIYQKYALG